MRLEKTAHHDHVWRVHALVEGLQLDAVWEYPIEARASEGQTFRTFCDLMDRSAEPPAGPTRALFRFRAWLGRVFRWDDAETHYLIPGTAVCSVQERIPEAERQRHPAPPPDSPFPLQLVYEHEEERLLELSNATAHALLHVGWIQRPDGTHTARLAVYTAPRGWLGRAYLLLIAPFRRFVVYPALMRMVGRLWRTDAGPEPQSCTR